MNKYTLPAIIIITLIAACNSQPNQQNISAVNNLSDSALFDTIQRRTFEYFWTGAEPNSGMAAERIHIDGDYPENDQSTIAVGGSGFGIMAVLTGIERNYITKQQGFARLQKIVAFLEKADRFHGAWPHWLLDENGHVRPFGFDDNGGDLVETSFLLEGLLCVRQYFKDGNEEERALSAKIDTLWKQVEFNWYRRNNQNVLYWHWSPDYEWKKNFAVHGYNECLIMYVLAASSPTYSVPAAVYHEGWVQNGAINKTSHYKNDTLHLFMQGNPPHGGPLFWAHYSWLGLNPHGLKDQYADYWKEMSTMAKINYEWCVDNPKQYKGYGKDSWGLTASYSVKGYAAHAPDSTNDLGVISPTAALSSFPYTPDQSMAAMKHWYNDSTLRNKLLGPYGFYDAFSETDNWYPQKYLAIDQGPIVVMMENYRSGLLWKLFMGCDEVKAGLNKLGFKTVE
ncbi:glucoamylase family protein [Parafilimonas sp.]|uniref:glucoamylase family protein n=1 Tax=Parafilimonas sp. TaxID=1969739 RepID=UPI0039E4F9FC